MKFLSLRLAELLMMLLLTPAYGQPAGSLAAPKSWDGGYLGAKDNKRKVAVVFVHGVLGSYRDSWTNKNGTYWPQLLTEDSAFADANVYVHSYQSPRLENAQNIEELATRLGDFLNRDRVIQDHDRLVFVTHSMGGLITRAFLVQARLPAKKVPLIYFYGTPTAGANAAALAYLVSKNPQFQNMAPFVPGTYVEMLAKKWLATSEDPTTGYPRTIWSFCAYEKKEYLGKIVVDELSATHLCNAQPRSILQDHIDMVKPESNNSEAHVYLTRAYQIATTPAGPALLAAMNASAIRTGTVYLPGSQAGSLDRYRFRTEMLDAGTLRVECNEIREGSRAISWPRHTSENLFAAVASVEAGQGLSRSAISVSSWTNNEIAFKYQLKGNTTQVGNCPIPGTANIKIKYLAIERE
jgi:hypothetical protein